MREHKELIHVPAWQAFTVAIVIEGYLGYELIELSGVRDGSTSVGWLLGVLCVCGLAVLFLLPVLRRGYLWQRVVAAMLCVFPIWILAVYAHGIINMVTER